MDIVAIWVMKKQILLPKEEPIYITLTFLKLPIPTVTWDVVIRERTKQNIWTKWRDAHPSQFARVWRKRFSRSTRKLNRGNFGEPLCLN